MLHYQPKEKIHRETLEVVESDGKEPFGLVLERMYVCVYIYIYISGMKNCILGE
jgi:hypothetical protein